MTGGCRQCKNYRGIFKPTKITKNRTVYGFCLKDLKETFGSATLVCDPVGGACKSFDKRTKDEKSKEEPSMKENRKEAVERLRQLANTNYKKNEMKISVNYESCLAKTEKLMESK